MDFLPGISDGQLSADESRKARPARPDRVEKPWGQASLPPPFADPGDRGRTIGEIIFSTPKSANCELLIKFLFTSEKLSIQVHPDSSGTGGEGRGKDEAWIVFAAEPEATIGLGLARPLSPAELRSAATDGTIETLVDWRPVKAGDAYYSPAGTIHAIGPGLALLEIQQNLDVTYRLYDYGRPRELHLDEGVEAAKTWLCPKLERRRDLGDGRTRLAGGPAFQVEELKGPAKGRLNPPCGELWLIALAGTGEVAGEPVKAGDVRRVTRPDALRIAKSGCFVLAYPGAETAPAWKAD